MTDTKFMMISPKVVEAERVFKESGATPQNGRPLDRQPSRLADLEESTSGSACPRNGSTRKGGGLWRLTDLGPSSRAFAPPPALPTELSDAVDKTYSLRKTTCRKRDQGVFAALPRTSQPFSDSVLCAWVAHSSLYPNGPRTRIFIPTGIVDQNRRRRRNLVGSRIEKQNSKDRPLVRGADHADLTGIRLVSEPGLSSKVQGAQKHPRICSTIGLLAFPSVLDTQRISGKLRSGGRKRKKGDMTFSAFLR